MPSATTWRWEPEPQRRLQQERESYLVPGAGVVAEVGGALVGRESAEVLAVQPEEALQGGDWTGAPVWS